MTADQTPEVPEGLMVVAAPPGASETVTEERLPFALPQLEGEETYVLWANRPKNMLLMYVADKLHDAAQTDNPAVTLDAYRHFANVCLEPESRTHLWARLGDPDDFLDEPHLKAMTEQIMERWVPGRPTGPRSGSGALQRGTGRPSTGRKRSSGKTRKG